MKILMGYDGSECAGDALKDLQRAGLPRAAEALVTSVAEKWLPPPPPSSYEVADAAFVGRILGGVIEARRQSSQAVEEAFFCSNFLPRLGSPVFGLRCRDITAIKRRMSHGGFHARNGKDHPALSPFRGLLLGDILV
jgi:hypothetical protein